MLAGYGQHVVDVGGVRRRASGAFHLGHGQPGGFNQTVVERPFDGSHHPVRQFLQQVGVGRFGQCQRHGAPESFQVVIVLPQVVLKRFQG